MLLGRKKGWIGIDLGSRVLKLVQTERAGDGLRVASSVVMPRPRDPRAENGSGEQDCNWSGQEIAAALSVNGGFAGRRAACVLPMRLTDLHVLSVPGGRTAEQRAIIRHELATIFAGDPQERQFDYWNMDSPDGANAEGTQTIGVLSVPRSLVCRVVGSFAEAGCVCEVMDGLPAALARALLLAYGPRPGAAPAALDWGFTGATFCVASAGQPLFARRLRNCGVGLLTDALRRSLGVCEAEAMQLLATHGLPPEGRTREEDREIQDVILEITAQQLNETVHEVKKTVHYLKMQYPALVPQRLCLLGGGATIKNVCSFLPPKLGMPVELWHLPGSDNGQRQADGHPLQILGTAMALSALAWAS